MQREQGTLERDSHAHPVIYSTILFFVVVVVVANNRDTNSLS